MKTSPGFVPQRVLILAGSIALLAVPAANAATVTFDGGTNGTGTALDVAANWVGDALPTSTSEVLLDQSAITLPATLSASTAISYGDLIFNPTNNASLTVSLTSGSLTLTGNTSGGAAAIAAGGAASDLLVVGNGVTSGSLTISGQIVALAASGNFDVVNSGAALKVSSAVSGAYALTKTGAGTLILNGANTFTGGFTLNSGTVTLGNANALGVTGGTVTLNGGTINCGSDGYLDAYNFALNGDFTYTGSGAWIGMRQTRSFVLGGSAATHSINVAGAATTLYMRAVISEGTTSMGLTKDGAGTLVLQGASTFTGGFTLNSGTVGVGNANALGATGGTVTLNGGTLNNSTDGYLNNYNFALNGDFTYTGVNGWIDINHTHTFTLGGSSGTSHTINVASGYSLYMGSVISGAAGLTKDGAGTLQLTQANTFSGGFTLNAGTAQLWNVNSMGADGSTITLNGGTISNPNGDHYLDAYNFILNGNVTYTGGGAWIGLSSRATRTFALGNGTATHSINVADAATTLYMGSVVTGTSGLAKDGAGTLQLSSANTFSGGFTLNSGTVSVGNANSLGATGGTVTLNGGTLKASDGLLNNYNFAVNGDFTYAGANAWIDQYAAHTFVLGGSGTSRSINVANGLTLYMGSVISGAMGLTKDGAGILSLTQANTYTGATTISSGTLSLWGGTIAKSPTINIASGAVFDVSSYTYGFHIVSGQTVKGTGNLNIGSGRTIVIDSGAHWAPGNSIGTNSVTGDLRLDPGSIADIELGTANATHTAANTANNNDRTTVSGALALGGTLNLIDWANSGSTNGSAGAGSYLIFTQTGLATGSFSNVVNISGYHAKVDQSVSGSVYVDNYQIASANTLDTTVNLGKFHVGSAPTATRTLTNQGSTVLSEGLAVTSSTTGGATVSGIPGSSIAGGASTTLTFGVTDGAGVKDGTVVLGLSSDGSASGYTNTALTSQTINVTGTGYNYAAANTLSTVNVGVTHVNGSFGNAAVTVQNTAASGIYTEGLNATKGATTGAATVGGSDITNLAGGTSSNAITVGLGNADTTSVGAKSGTVTVGFASNGTNSGFSDTTQADQTVTVNGQVNYYADPTLTAVSGGDLTETNATHYTLDLGSFKSNTGEYTATISLNNFLQDAIYQDLLSGTFDTSAKGLFTLSGFDGTLTAIASGTNVTLTVSFDTAGASKGDYEGTILFNPTSANASGTSSLSQVSLGLEFTVVPEPSTWAMIVGGMGMLAFGQRLRRRTSR